MESMRRLYPVAVVGGIILGIFLQLMIWDFDNVNGHPAFWGCAAFILFVLLLAFYLIETEDIPQPIRYWWLISKTPCHRFRIFSRAPPESSHAGPYFINFLLKVATKMRKYISNSFIGWIITMLRNLCTPLTMKILGLGCPLHKAERIAAVMVVWVVLLLAMMGYTVTTTGVPERDPDNESGSPCISLHGTAPVSICGSLPAGAGIMVGSPRSLLHTR
jgi:hypothetical protein